MFSPIAAQIIVVPAGGRCRSSPSAYAFLLFVDDGRSRARARSRASPSARRPSSSEGPPTPGNEALNTRKQQVQDTIADMEAREKAKKKVSLRIKLQRAGLETTPQQFWIASAISGVGVGAIVLPHRARRCSSRSLAAFGGGFGLPNWVLGFLFKRRKKPSCRSSPTPSTSSSAASSRACR